ncbi:MAG: fused MFS/spermidine synthase [Nibricoccus sp.]
MQRLFTLLAHVVVPLAAFLTFMLQPIAGKLLLPVYGGSAGTWLTLSMFFQGVLLAGYALAWRGLEKHRDILPKFIAILAVLAPLSLRLPLWAFPGLPEWPGVLASLTLSLLPTVLLTTASGLVLQGWLQQRSGRPPFYLYAISNVGSILALLAYPFAIETHIGLVRQIFILKCLLWILCAALLVLSGLQWSTTKDAPSSLPDTEPEELPQGAVVAWFILSFFTCTLMLGAIPILSAEYGSNPLTWLVPLGFYLLSFSFTFSGWWRPAFNYIALVALSFALFGFMQAKGISATSLKQWAKLWLMVVLFFGCLGGQGYLYQLRPARRAFFFYLVIAAGGLAAGIFVSGIAPLLLNRNLEFTAAAFFLLTFLALQLLGKKEAIARASLVLMVVVPSAWFVYTQLKIERAGEIRPMFFRNTYGTLLLEQIGRQLWLSNETTLHGVQVLDKKSRRVPTSYYTRGSAVGGVLNALQKTQPSLRVASIGLGSGTLAVYGRKDDLFAFWDINPLAIRIAREYFYYLRDCPAKIEIHQRDGRLGLSAYPGRFDVIVLDAFAGDSVPAHLITREAIAGYIARLDHGILLAHISSRTFDLYPVIAAGARQAGWNCMYVNSTPHKSVEQSLLAMNTSYAVIFPPDREAEVTQWFDALGKDPDFDLLVDQSLDGYKVEWTDDRSAIMDLLTLNNLLRR